MKKTAGLALVLLIISSVSLVATTLGWGVHVRFYFGLLPFQKSKSASVEAYDPNGRYVVRPISDRYQLKFMNFITSVTRGEEEEVILEGKHSVCSLMNRTEPLFNIGWVNITKIRIFEMEYDVWFLQMWVNNEAIYLNIRYQSEEYIVEKLFLIDDAALAIEAHDLMMDAWSENYIAQARS